MQEEQEGLPETADWQKAKRAGGDQPVPGWVSIDENAYWLWGWPGHRTRPGRTGYDPLDSDFEVAHVEVVILRQLLTGRFRPHNPVYLLLMVLVGLILCWPLYFGGMVFLQQDWASLLIVVLLSPSYVVGVALFNAVYLSLGEEKIRID